MQWYLVYTKPRMERWARTSLWERGLEVYLPQYRKRRRHARRVDYVSAPLFPCYLFVEMDVTRTQWRAIRSTVGVSGIICLDGLPAPVPQGIVEEIAACENDYGMIVLPRRAPFEHGQPIQITSGAMCDQVGLFESMSDADRVVLLLDLLGRHALLQHGDEYFGIDHLGHQLDRQSSERNQTQQRNAEKKHRRGHRASYREIRQAQANLPRRRSIVS